MNDMALPAAAVVGTAAGAGLMYAGYTGKKIYEAIVDEVDPDGTFSLFAQPDSRPRMGGKAAAQAMVDPVMRETPPRTQSAMEPEPQDYSGDGTYQDDTDPDEDFAPPVDDALSESAPASARTIIQDGQWKYEVLPKGVVKIVDGPPGSKAIDMVLDPQQIAAMTDGPSKARLTRAYDSIKSVSMNGPPLPPIRAAKKSAPAAPAEAPAARPSPPPPVSQDVEGYARTPAFGAGREAVVESSPAPGGESYGRVRGLMRRFKDKPVEGGGAF